MMRTPWVGAIAAAKAATVNTPTPRANTARRLKMSARRPLNSRNPAKVTA
jgi:hypothetical protein